MFDLEALKVFGRLADLGTISETARALGMPKSSVSRAIVRLEEQAGTALVERSARRLRLTDAGILFERHSLRILEEVKVAEDAIGDFIGKPRGKLRISVPFTFAIGSVAPMLPAFSERYPEIRTSLIIENRRVDVAGEGYDLAIRTGRLADSSMIARRILSSESWLCASPEYLEKYGTPNSLQDLSTHKLVGFADESETWRLRARNGLEDTIAAAPNILARDPSVMQAIVQAGGGIGLFTDYLASKSIKACKLIRVLPQYRGPNIDVHAVYIGRTSLSSKVRVFVEALLEYVGRER